MINEVYNGDTVTADVDLGFSVWVRGERLRLARIDAPEVRGADKEVPWIWTILTIAAPAVYC